MSIKRITWVLVCLVVASGLSAQKLSSKDQKAINTRMGSFLELMEAKNYTGTLDFIYPKFFEHSPKQAMFQTFAMLEKSGIELKFNDLEILEIIALPREGGIDYALVKYRLNMELPLSTDELKAYAALMVPILQNEFGSDNVEYNQKENYIKVTGEKFLMAVKDPNYNDWMFLIYDESFKEALAKTIPAKINKIAISVVSNQ